MGCFYLFLFYALNNWSIRLHSKGSVNVEHLWSLFRDNFGKMDNSGLWNREDATIRDSYTLKQTLYDVSFKTSISDKANAFYQRYLSDLEAFKMGLRRNNKSITFYLFKKNLKGISFKRHIFNYRRKLQKMIRKINVKINDILISERMIISKELKNILTNEYNTDLTFEYKRFAMDPRFVSYYNIRVLEPTKMSIFLSMGYKYNKYLRCIYHHDVYDDIYSETLKQDELIGISILTQFYNYMTRLDNLLFHGDGSILLYNKNQASTFAVYHKSFGNTYYLLPGRPYIKDEMHFGVYVLFVVMLKLTYSMAYGNELEESATVLTADIVHSLIATQFESLYDLGMYYHFLLHGGDLLDEYNAGHPDSDEIFGSYQEILIKVHPLHDYFNVLRSDNIYASGTSGSNFGPPVLDLAGYYKPLGVFFKNYYYYLGDSIYVPFYSYKFGIYNTFTIIFTLFVGYIAYLDSGVPVDCNKQKNIILSKWLNPDLIIQYKIASNVYKGYGSNYLNRYKKKKHK